MHETNSNLKGDRVTASLKNVFDRAEKMGRHAADRDRDGRTGTFRMAGLRRLRPGGNVGLLALDAYREYGEVGMKAVFKGYQAGSNGWSEGRALWVSAVEEEAA
ncbi:hypothetical protein [Arthrobacter sp. ES1]|uniref:hypothetical protein n=1 Tax=Arthrobacter sp. ES1 TaxID=1897056 RepID=UPI001CFFEE46|nr:hypothetical protein [Arthrobacter sp. ES1]MCB5280352.1 hypothetical protein [Arthrobacter sp. ES1]